jgi:hypothetical protein
MARPGSAAPHAPSANSIVTIDAAGDVGRYASLALDRDGRPFVSYWDATNEDLKLASCSDAACSGSVSVVTLDAGVVGGYTSLALLHRITPGVSYFHGNLDVPKGYPAVMRCGDPDCTLSHRAVLKETGSTFTGLGSAMRFDANGLQVISHVSGGLGLQLTRCSDRRCFGTRTGDVDPDTFGVQTSLQLDADDNPVIAYAGFDGLHVVHCQDDLCVPPQPISPPYPLGSFGWQAGVAMAMDRQARPVVVFHWWDGVTSSVRVLRCGDTDCSTGRVAVIDTGVPMTAAGIAVDASGNPVVAYATTTDGGLAVVHCGSPDCSTGNVRSVPDASAPAGDAALVLDATGDPVLAYYAAASGDLRLLTCGSPTCA